VDLERGSEALSYLDELNTQIVAEVFRLGPRNLSEVARTIGASKRTVHARFTKLRRKGLLHVRAVPVYHSMGLIGVYLFARVPPSRRAGALKALSANDYVREVRYCVGRFNGLLAQLAIPVERVKEFEEYVGELERLGALEDYQIRYVVDFKPFLPNFSYFNFKARRWEFSAERFLSDMSRYGLGRVALRDPEHFRADLDYLDVLIVWALERDATTRLATIARIANVNRSLIKYHMDVHVSSRLIRGYAVEMPFFAPGTYGTYLLEAEFSDPSGLASFAYAMSRTPYARVMCKEYRRDALFVTLEVPVSEVCSLVFDVVGELSEEHGLTSYEFHMLSLTSALRRPLPKDLFDEDAGWRYRGDSYLSEARRAVAAGP